MKKKTFGQVLDTKYKFYLEFYELYKFCCSRVGFGDDDDNDDDMRVCAIKQWIKKEEPYNYHREKKRKTYCLWCDIINRAHWIVLVGSDSL